MFQHLSIRWQQSSTRDLHFPHKLYRRQGKRLCSHIIISMTIEAQCTCFHDKCHEGCFLMCIITVMDVQELWPQILMAMGVWSCWYLTVKVQHSRSLSTKSTRWVWGILKLSTPVWHSGGRTSAKPTFSVGRAPRTHGCGWFPGPSLVLSPGELKWWCTQKRPAHTHGSSMVARGTCVRWSLSPTLASVTLHWLLSAISLLIIWVINRSVVFFSLRVSTVATVLSFFFFTDSQAETQWNWIFDKSSHCRGWMWRLIELYSEMLTQTEKLTQSVSQRAAARRKVKALFHTLSLIRHPWESELPVGGTEGEEMGDRCCRWKPARFVRNRLPFLFLLLSSTPPGQSPGSHPGSVAHPPLLSGPARWACSVSGLCKHTHQLWRPLSFNAWLARTHAKSTLSTPLWLQKCVTTCRHVKCAPHH